MSNPTPGVPDWFAVLDHEPIHNRVFGKALLSRFLCTKEITDIRDGVAYDESDADLKLLMASINADGELRLDTAVKVVLNDNGDHLEVLGGNRRITAALANLRNGNFKTEPEVRCWLYLTSDRKDRLRVAGRDNAFHRPMNEMEQFRQTVALSRRGLNDGEIATNLGVDKRTIERHMLISLHPVLVEMLKAKMPYSRLARIAEKLKKLEMPDVTAATMAFFDNWLKVDVPARIQAKKNEFAKRKKTASPAVLEPGKLLKPGEYEGWLRDIESGIAPTGKPRVADLTVDADPLKLRISGISLDLTKTTSHEIGKILVDMRTEGIRALEKALKDRQRAEQDEDDNPDPDLEKAKLYDEYNLNPDQDADDSNDAAGDDADADADDEGADADDVAGFDDDAT